MNVYRVILLIMAVGWLASTALPLSSVSEARAQSESDGLIKSAELWWRGEDDYQDGDVTRLALGPEIVSLETGASDGVYLSPEIQAPLPFNALFSRWQVDGYDLESGGIRLMIRTRATDGAWSPWATIETDADMTLPGDDYQTGTIVTVPAEDQLHDFFQFSVELFADSGGTSPLLDTLRFTFIDSSAGPSDEELLAAQQPTAPQEGAAYAKPAVVSRSQWCQSEPNLPCSYNNPDPDSQFHLDYVPVTHLVVHHTVTSNTSGDWAATVRAIWRFHGLDRGWGDIGYNYLVAPNGLIFEGHYGGDDVAGTHAGNANHGSMGVAMLGDYTNIDPPWALRDPLVKILAWKADQKNINVFSASKLPDEGFNLTDRGMPHLMGHRDVYGGPPQTFCPGLNGHTWLPWIKNEVANRIGFVSPHIYYDEWENGSDTGLFTKSNNSWHVPGYDCGNNGHAYFTYSTENVFDSSNWGIYRPQVPFEGLYEIETYAPYCNIGGPETFGAEYEVRHANGVSYVTVNQQERIGLWSSLGVFELNNSGNHYIRLTDLTETDTGRAVWFDAIRIRPLAPTAYNSLPAMDSWQLNSTVNFNWRILNLSDGNNVILKVASNPGMNNLVLWQSLPFVESYNHTFSQNYLDLYWQVEARNPQGVVIVSPVTHFGLDIDPPTSNVTNMMRLNSTTYAVGWTGSDTLSGISSYNIQYRANGSSTWHNCLTGTTHTSAVCNVGSTGLFWFRSQATDVAGHVENAGNGDMHTGQAVVSVVWNILPIIGK